MGFMGGKKIATVKVSREGEKKFPSPMEKDGHNSYHIASVSQIFL